MQPETERAIIDGLAATIKALRYALAGCLIIAATFGYEGFIGDPGRFWWAIVLAFLWGLAEGIGGKVQAQANATMRDRLRDLEGGPR